MLGDHAFEMHDFMLSNFDGFRFQAFPVVVTRCGYTGEDGFEVSVPNERVHAFVEKLLAEVNPADGLEYGQMVGLAARDSLRLEAGLCLYGHDLSKDVSPIEASLLWTISKRRREEGGFLGFEKVKDHMENGVSRKRVGFKVQAKMPVREGAEVFTKGGDKVGTVTSGGPAPSL